MVSFRHLQPRKDGGVFASSDLYFVAYLKPTGATDIVMCTRELENAQWMKVLQRSKILTWKILYWKKTPPKTSLRLKATQIDLYSLPRVFFNRGSLFFYSFTNNY